jgi:hypothetical protein
MQHPFFYHSIYFYLLFKTSFGFDHEPRRYLSRPVFEQDRSRIFCSSANVEDNVAIATRC